MKVPMLKTVAQTLSLNNKLIFLISLTALSVGCSTGRPTLEYVLAKQAFSSAKEVEASRYAPGFYHRAEEAYRRGVVFFNSHSYKEAIDEFKQARSFAEKAENVARIQRQKNGEEPL